MDINEIMGRQTLHFYLLDAFTCIFSFAFGKISCLVWTLFYAFVKYEM